MAAKVAEKGPNYGTIQFLHDPARPLFVRVARQKLPDFGWEVLTLPPYRPGLEPKDYQLLLTLSNALQGKACDDEDDSDRWLSKFFELVSAQLYAECIETLPKNWQRAIVCDGDSFIS
ncbi:hypothetical protein Y032_0030g2032 [Ancylostoma ceylanicum]|uniref:Tc1-like transposase DDE domain-containing protein n=1 Tax=Ancylostoma ceylanicum TaxID=53326 RepID=A0A016URF4_9BILA|nr:hypothetical protein Y032_0030g2032 [Ancylostoma ceylanicum]